MTLLNIGNPFPNPNQVFLHLKIIHFLKQGVKVINLSSILGETRSLRDYLLKDEINKLTLVSYRLWSPQNALVLLKAILTTSVLNNYKLVRNIYNNTSSIKEAIASIKMNLILIYYSRKADILHFDWSNQAVGFLEGLKFIKKPVIISIRGKAIAVQPLIQPELLEKYQVLFQRANAIHSISNGLVKYLEPYGIAEEKIKIISPAIDWEYFNGLSNAKIIEKNNNKIQIITVAHLVWKKNLLATIKVIKTLVSRGYNISYKIIGDGPDKEPLSFAIEDLGLKKQVYLCGFLPHQEVIKELQQSDIFLMPSIQEGFCNAVIEAQAVGLPVIVSNAEGLEENIEPGVTGFCYDRWNLDELLSCMEKLIESAELRLRFGNNGRMRVEKKFKIEYQIEQFKSLYQEIIRQYDKTG